MKTRTGQRCRDARSRGITFIVDDQRSDLEE